MSSKNRKIPSMILLVILVGALAAGAYFSLHALRGTKVGRVIGLKDVAQAKDVYYCPMHPYYKSDKPGDCPICNMRLVKLEPSGAPAGGEMQAGMPTGAPSEGSLPAEAMAPGTVHISPEKQQLIGVKYGEVTQEPLTKTVRTVGRITYDETKIVRVQPKIEGWIEKVYVDFTGKPVKKGQPLISIYSPELVSTQQEFLISSRAKDTLKDSPVKEIGINAESLYQSARERLRLWDISEEQVRDLEKRGTPTKTLTLYAPAGGFVLNRNAYEKQRITQDTELYTIADLSTVWVLADVYEYELPMIKIGQAATMTLPYVPGDAFRGKVAYIYPQLDATTRTLKVRLEFPNPGLALKPEMYADVALEIDYGRQISVPEGAVLDSGIEQIVFVAHEAGQLEPRKVQLGAKVDDRFIVLSGLAPGERIVTSGNFLIDSESQLKSALGTMTGGGHEGHGGSPPAGSEQKGTGTVPEHSNH